MDRQMRLMGVVVALVSLIPVGILTSAANLPFPSVLRLERAEHLKGSTLKQLIEWDMAQHARRRLLGGAQDTTEIVQLPVLGSIDHYAGSPFLTQVSLGNPAKSFTVLVDSGSSTMWVSCTPCSGCPAPSKYRDSYDPSTSWSSAVLSVSDDWCGASIRRGFASRGDSDQQNGRCGYSLVYGGGATTAGYYVSDDVHFNATGHDVASLISSPIVFGCGNLQTGDLADSGLGFDGILGIGPNENSINSQLNLVGLAPNVFSLCLKSSDSGDGVLAFGEAVVPGLTYTPLVPSESYYSLKLEGISVNSKMLPIDPSVFVSHKRQTIADSGTTLAYLADEAYNPFINAISAAVAPSVRPVENGGEHCFVASGSLESLFPSVALHFSGGAVMMLNPRNYLLQESLMDDHSTFCVGWKRHESQRLTILGDIVLMDKIIVHDLDNMRIGWVDFDCSQSINVTTSHHWKQRHANSGNASFVVSITSAVAVILTNVLIFCI